MNKIKPKVLGGIGKKKSNGGKQWYQQDRIYDNEIAISITTSFQPYYYIGGNMNNLKTQLCNYLIENDKVKQYDVIRHSYSTSRMKEWKKRNIETNNEVPTLDTRCDCLGVVVKGENMNNLRIRKLTPKECWRLMGFDDTDFEKAAKVNSNAQLYKQAGNSIVVNVLEAILTNLLLEHNTEVLEGQLSIYDLN